MVNFTQKTCTVCGGVGADQTDTCLCPDCMQKHVTINLWLDDEREPPAGWAPLTHTKHVILALDLFYRDPPINAHIHAISLDNDLGEGETEGYKVLDWIEEMVVTTDFIPPVIYIHTANPVARERMRSTLEQIQMRLDDKGVKKNVIGD